MRVIVCALLLVLIAATSVIAADASARPAPEPGSANGPARAVDTSLARAMDCCHPILVLQGYLKHQPLCLDLRHKCLTPYAPCPAEICLVPACHKPLTPCIPEGRDICRPKACHKPLTVFMPEDVCAPACAGKCKHAGDCGCDNCSSDSGSDAANAESS